MAEMFWTVVGIALSSSYTLFAVHAYADHDVGAAALDASLAVAWALLTVVGAITNNGARG